ncbi:uncharacterized protein [Haliotis cracherodii]|uniref:uncharacterized protein n=1 Tax=Haliotis cracherodii TaxID=6455 RepID=UPI0039ECA39D
MAILKCLTSLPVLLLVTYSISAAFDINDPKTNIDSLIRVIGSSNPADVDVLYGNGTIFGRQPSQKLEKLFYFEGYNIGRKVHTGNGYLSLTREVFVYRHIVTGEIIYIWHNAYSQNSNEIFHVRNDPVDMNFTYGAEVVPTVRFPGHGFGFTSDILLQYPNELDPAHYKEFSAGPLYQADELFQYFSDYDVLTTTNISSLNMTGAWFRRAQYLPWMQMGDTPGHLYYQTTNWKCLNGLQDLSEDLLHFVQSNFPQFLEPPSVFNPIPETTWHVIKQVIDSRRKQGLPDIILPTVNISTHVTPKANSLDPRVEPLFTKDNTDVFFNGSIYSEITGKQSIELFKLTGTFKASAVGFGLPDIFLNVRVSGDFCDPITLKELKYFKNPFTNATVRVPKFASDKEIIFNKDNVFSMAVPHLEKLSVQAQTSHTTHLPGNGCEIWEVDMLTLFFKDCDLKKPNPFFYGTWVRFTSWLDWMGMTGIDGNLVWRMSINRVTPSPGHPVGKK